MKKNYIFPILGLALALGSMSYMKFSNAKIESYKNSHIKNSNGGPAGRSGAPGESNCTDCHSGAFQNGDANITLAFTANGSLVTEYTPGEMYSVGVSISNGASKNGMQLTARTDANNTSGVLTAIPGSTSKQSQAGKEYINHTSASNTQSAWAFQWQAPSTDEGDITFYVAVNKTNSNGGTNGDIVFLTQKVISVAASTANITILAKEAQVNYYTKQRKLELTGDYTANAIFVNIVDLTGKSVYTNTVNKANLSMFIPESIQNGAYMIHIFDGNNSKTKKIYIR